MLKLKTKSVRFEFVDDDVESVVTLSSDDDEATLVRKLKRIIALAEGGQTAMPLAERMGSPLVDFATRAADFKERAPEVAATNGWAAAYGPPALPDRLKGEVELIQPGEDA